MAHRNHRNHRIAIRFALAPSGWKVHANYFCPHAKAQRAAKLLRMVTPLIFHLSSLIFNRSSFNFHRSSFIVQRSFLYCIFTWQFSTSVVCALLCILRILCANKNKDAPYVRTSQVNFTPQGRFSLLTKHIRTSQVKFHTASSIMREYSSYSQVFSQISSPQVGLFLT